MMELLMRWFRRHRYHPSGTHAEEAGTSYHELVEREENIDRRVDALERLAEQLRETQDAARRQH